MLRYRMKKTRIDEAGGRSFLEDPEGNKGFQIGWKEKKLHSLDFVDKKASFEGVF